MSTRLNIDYSKPVWVSPHVQRLTVNNPSPMTGPGTNTYLLGNPQREEGIAVIDPGPADAAHIDAILKACAGQLRWILVTHTHPDHSPAAAVLARETGAQLLGNRLQDNDGLQDESFLPDQSFKHDERISLAGVNLRVLYTPGHVDNHLCYLVEEDGLLVTGDHIMQGSTVVIIPPHGVMKDYIESLNLLLDYPILAIAPGHGLIIDKPEQEIRHLISHRLGREAKVIEKLSQVRRASLANLTPIVYDDVDPAVHRIAELSLRAHLIKLETEGRVSQADEEWIFHH